MENNLSIGKILLLIYVIVSSSQCVNLFSHGFKEAIETNRYVQHLILILLIMSLLLLFGNPFGTQITTSHIVNISILTLLIYGWFILTTKMSMMWNIGIIVMLGIYFLYESDASNKLNIKLDSGALDVDQKKQLVNTYTQTNNWMLMALFGFTLCGTFLYSNEKHDQIQLGGGQFDLQKFWFE